ncbi:MAG: nucleotide exchange factor GrpE [Clostridia bacterium]|nr:nucleotide exchange factor GrpE [Clostridia bacterium]
MSEEKKNIPSEEIEEKEEIVGEEAAEDAKEQKEEEGTPSREEELLKKLEELEDRYMRLAAEYDNYKKRTQREKEAKYADALIDVLVDVLPIADNLERAVAAEVESDEAKKVQEGVLMVTKQFAEVLDKLGVSVIDTKDKQFDPNLHNAVMHIEDENLGENVIVEEFMKGYIYKGERVVRHSMVKVAN